MNPDSHALVTRTKAIAIGAAIAVIAIVGVLLLARPFAPTPIPSSLESESNEVAVIETKLGRIVIEFFPSQAPRHVENFKKLARDGFYDGTTFHRVIPGFVIQGGDSNTKDADRSNDGLGGPGYTLPQELNDISHVRGVVSMARAQEDSGSQFFIMVGDATHLDKDFSAFGRVVEGMDVVDKIANLERDERDNPIGRVEIRVSITTLEELGKS